MIVSKLIVAGVAGAVVGGGAMAVAPSMAATTTSSTTSAHVRAHHRHVVAGSWTTANGVHHELIRGTVVTVSSSSITVRDKFGKRETFSVSPSTKVVSAQDHKRSDSSISQVKTGDRAVVRGRGDMKAVRIVFHAPKSSSGGTA